MVNYLLLNVPLILVNIKHIIEQNIFTKKFSKILILTQNSKLVLAYILYPMHYTDVNI